MYLEEPVERYIENIGWTTERPTKKQTVLQVSLKYYDMVNNEIVAEGTEDFTIERLQQIRRTYKLQLTDVKIFHKSPTARWEPSKTQYRTVKTNQPIQVNCIYIYTYLEIFKRIIINQVLLSNKNIRRIKHENYN